MKKYIAMIISLLLAFINVNIALANNNDNIENYKFEKDITMSGVISSTQKFFTIYENWDIMDVKFNLIFTKSEILNADDSTITVFVNDKPIYSMRLEDEKKYKDEVEIVIPKDVIKSGVNSLTIKSYKTISDKVCRDDANVANWLLIHEESNLSVRYGYKQIDNKISYYKDIFTQVDQSQEVDTVISIPNNSSIEEINGAVNLSVDLGKKLKNDKFRLDVKYESELKYYNKNIIYIATSNSISRDKLDLFTQEEIEKSKDKAIIKLVDSPYNDRSKKMLVILSYNDEALKKAIQLMSSDTLINSLNKESIYIDKDLDVEDLYEEENLNKIYLKDLGYDNTLLQGPFTQEVIYDIAIPKGKVATSQSNINIDFRYAKNLDFEKSLITVYINEAPIGSKKLSAENADNDNLSISLPKDILDKNYLQVKVVFNLELRDLECVTRDVEIPWAYVLNDSHFDFKYKNEDLANFYTYPYPFTFNNMINDLDIVIPNKINDQQLSNISSIASYIGREVKYNNSQVNVLTYDEFIETDKNNNVIVIGTPSNNNLIKDINSDLNIKYNEDFTGFTSNDKIKFIEGIGYEREIAVMQFIESPYKSNKTFLVVSSVNNSDLDLASKYMSDLESINKLYSDTIVIDRSEKVQNIDFVDINNSLDTENNNTSTLNPNTKIFILVATILVITLVISIVFIVRKYKN